MTIRRRHRDARSLVMLAFTGGMINAAQTTMFALAANVYPTAMRATGVGTAVASAVPAPILSGYAGPWALEYSRQHLVLRGDGRRAGRDASVAGVGAAAHKERMKEEGRRALGLQLSAGQRQVGRRTRSPSALERGAPHVISC